MFEWIKKNIGKGLALSVLATPLLTAGHHGGGHERGNISINDVSRQRYAYKDSKRDYRSSDDRRSYGRDRRYYGKGYHKNYYQNNYYVTGYPGYYNGYVTPYPNPYPAYYYNYPYYDANPYDNNYTYPSYDTGPRVGLYMQLQ